MVDQEITGKNHQIAILGWGSLLWDEENNRHFDRLHGPWMLDGPDLQLEFSRKSQTRSGALTLVIDSKHGAASTVAYAISTRAEPQAAINATCDAGKVPLARTSADSLEIIPR